MLSIALEEGGSRGAGLYSENSAVDVDFRTCDVGRFIGSQEQNGVRHLVNLSWPAHRHYAHAFGSHGGVGSATRCAHWRHDAGMNRVGADVILGVLHATDLVISRTAAFEALYAM